MQSTANSPYHACLQPKSNQLTNQSYPINQTNHLIVQGYCEQTPVYLMIDTGASVSLVATIVGAQTFKNCKSLAFRVKSDFSTFITSLNDA